MKNTNKFALFYLISFLSIVLTSCSDSNKGTVGNNPTSSPIPVPELQLSPATSYDFGTITQGNTASPLELTLTNNGTSRLEIASITLSDMNNFQLDTTTGTNACGTASPAIDAGSNCTVEFSFTPTQAGTFPATVDIPSNDSNSPQQLSLTGTSEAVAPVMNVTINQVELGCPTVTAFVSVTDQGGFPIEGLGFNDFTIEEDTTTVGKPDTSDHVAVVTKPISIALVMDNSGSMSSIDIDESNRSALEIVEQLGTSDAVEIIKFDRDVEVVQTFTSNKQLLRDAINNTSLDGDGTSLFDAIQQAVNDTELQSTERKAIIVITDGANNNKNSTTGVQDVIDNAQTKDIPVFAIALGGDVDLATLQQISDGTSAELYEADVAQNLRTVIDQQLSEVLFIDQYVLTYTSVNTGAGTHSLTVQASKTGGFSGSDSRDVAQCP